MRGYLSLASSLLSSASKLEIDEAGLFKASEVRNLKVELKEEEHSKSDTKTNAATEHITHSSSLKMKYREPVTGDARKPRHDVKDSSKETGTHRVTISVERDHASTDNGSNEGATEGWQRNYHGNNEETSSLFQSVGKTLVTRKHQLQNYISSLLEGAERDVEPKGNVEKDVEANKGAGDSNAKDSKSNSDSENDSDPKKAPKNSEQTPADSEIAPTKPVRISEPEKTSSTPNKRKPLIRREEPTSNTLTTNGEVERKGTTKGGPISLEAVLDALLFWTVVCLFFLVFLAAGCGCFWWCFFFCLMHRAMEIENERQLQEQRELVAATRNSLIDQVVGVNGVRSLYGTTTLAAASLANHQAGTSAENNEVVSTTIGGYIRPFSGTANTTAGDAFDFLSRSLGLNRNVGDNTSDNTMFSSCQTPESRPVSARNNSRTISARNNSRPTSAGNSLRNHSSRGNISRISVTPGTPLQPLALSPFKSKPFSFDKKKQKE